MVQKFHHVIYFEILELEDLKDIIAPILYFKCVNMVGKQHWMSSSNLFPRCVIYLLQYLGIQVNLKKRFPIHAEVYFCSVR